MGMTLVQLRTFAVLADRGALRAAAEHLGVTPAAVSASVSALQRALDAQLVEPAGRGLRLTQAGEVYAGYVRLVLGLLDEAAAATAGGLDPARGRLRIAVVTTVGEHVLPPFLAGFRQRYPEVGFTLKVGTRQQVWSLLGAHEADVVLAGRPPAGAGLRVRATRANELVVVGAPGMAGDVDDATWLLREAGSGTRATTEAFLASREADPPRLTLGSNGAVVAGAVTGLGVTLVSRDAVQRELGGGQLVCLPVEGTPLQRPWHAVTADRPTATADLFVRYLLDAGAHDGSPWEAPDGSEALAED